ncbi:hypothetical protein [Desulfatibacillum alkenivorans]|nr:hypothetical protein [Desulfatibacillum alkenivorans]
MQRKQHGNCGRIFVCARREDFYAPPPLHFSETSAPQPDEKGGAPRSWGV